MSLHGRLREAMHEALIVAPGGYADIPGPLADLPRGQAREAVETAVHVAELFITEATRRSSPSTRHVSDTEGEPR